MTLIAIIKTTIQILISAILIPILIIIVVLVMVIIIMTGMIMRVVTENIQKQRQMFLIVKKVVLSNIIKWQSQVLNMKF